MLKVLARMATNALATSRIDRKSEVQREPRDNDQHDDWQGLHNPGSLDLRPTTVQSATTAAPA